ncbi:MAG TPA: PD-(D/E)XK nuclease family protein [Solirubrobacteraceae bacterium]|nr:PD-(D/E)XK nuclease family protein [Solirubrobacteraceae bacterium]
MPLTLVLGPANSAKAGEVLGAFAGAARSGALLVVPTALDAEHYTRELAARGAVIGSVLTFPGLAAEIARRAGYAGARLSALQRERVLRRVVGGLRFGVVDRSATAPGFAVAAGELIAELQRSLITPQRFASALRAWAQADPARRGGYAADLGSLYRAYISELDRVGRVDAELYAWRALDALRAEPGRWGQDSVFVYGFDDLTALERDAVETLARIVGVDVTVSLTYEPARAALTARAEVVAELRALAAHVRELPALDEYYAPASREALHQLERRLFESGAPRIDPGASVRLLEAGGERAEAELVAAEVLELLRSGVPADEVVVVSRTLGPEAALLEHVFARFGIPLAGRRRLPLTHTALGRSVRALARCALLGDEARAEDLLDYLRSPGLLERLEVADALERSVRREGIRTAAQARERLGWELLEIDAVAAADDQAAELARQARRLFAAPHRGCARVLGADEQLDARALAALLRAFGELDDLGEKVRGRDLLDLLESVEIVVQPAGRTGAVLLADPLSIRARRFRAVFVCGLCEGAFPLLDGGEPFLSDEHRHELALASGLRLPAGEGALDRERYLLYACVSRATDQIVFSYRSSDEEGNIVLPSPFLADLAELFVPEWAERRRRRLLADIVWDPEAAPTERERARSRARAAEPAGASEPERRLSAIALEHVRHREVVSGGALECFGDCPVRWLVERELAPSQLEPDPDPLARGNYMHGVLEEVIGRLGASVTAESLGEAVRILEDVVTEMPPTIAPGRSEAVRAAALRTIIADLRRYLAHEAADDCDWEPRGLELRFGFLGEEGALPAVTLGAGTSEQIQLRGVIDRVDVDPSGSGHAIVRDYKSGSQRPEYPAARWQADRRLQVALYMVAVRRLLGLDPVAGLYQPLGGGDLRARGVYLEGAPVGVRLVDRDARDADALEEILRDAEERAVQLAARLRTGELTPSPETCSRDGCKYPGICRSS